MMLKVNNIEASYLGVIRVLYGISLEVGDGQIVALIGANGGGKTTTLKAITCLLRTEQGAITSGDITLDGKRIDRFSPEQIANLGISQVMEGRRTLEHLTVEENLMVGAYRRRDRAGVKRDLETVYDYFPRIREYRKRVSGYLSGGEQQMMVIGRALMADPQLMLLDEPSLGLAPLAVQSIYEIIKQINKDRGLRCSSSSRTSRPRWVSRTTATSWRTGASFSAGPPTSCATTRMSKSSTWASRPPERARTTGR